MLSYYVVNILVVVIVVIAIGVAVVYHNFDKIVEHFYFKQPNNLALYDTLTGLYNRNWLSRFGMKKYMNSEVFITYIDLNGFKQINDTKGHMYANGVLKGLADKVRTYWYVDTTAECVRVGGDEFIIFSSINIEPYLDSDADDLISYGCYLKSKDESLNIAIDKADRKMYEYKRTIKKFIREDV